MKIAKKRNHTIADSRYDRRSVSSGSMGQGAFASGGFVELGRVLINREAGWRMMSACPRGDRLTHC